MSSFGTDTRIKLLLGFSYVFLAMLIAMQCAADCPGRGPLTVHLDDGEAGLWFDHAQSRCLLKAEVSAKSATYQLRVAEKQLQMRARVIADKNAEIALLEAADREKLVALEEQAADTEELSSWYYSPILWVAVGAVVGGALVIGATKL